ncbi:MAG: hypothetical protein CMJ46_08605 [Planctomyces sp.]|nr:hypothetical protein [Planctomyces sp.]
MHRFPYINDYVNDVFARERTRWDFLYLRPLLLVLYFFVRIIIFPFKFVLHRFPFGYEAWFIDRSMAFGMKYLASHDAAELFIRHIQIEPLLYRFLLSLEGIETPRTDRKLNGIDGDYGIDEIRGLAKSNLTLGHDQLSYEVLDRFDKQTFLANLPWLRSLKPEDHNQFSKKALEENRKHSYQLLGPTNIVMLVVMAITVFGDLRTTVTALNSFDSDSLLLWCLKQIYAHDPSAQVDLDFFLQETSNRGHYNASVFFSNPSQYLYYHIVFDEVVYEMLRTRPAPSGQPAS